MLKQQKRLRIMIVDDHETLRRTLCLFVQQQDELVLAGEAANGQEALELCALTRPDIVLMDIFMPHMDGVTATRAIHDAYPNIRVIGMTGQHTRENIADALAAGATACLDKNDLTTRLLSIIHESLRTPTA